MVEPVELARFKSYLTLRISLLLSVMLMLLIIAYGVFSAVVSEKDYNVMLIRLASTQKMQIYKYTSEVNQALIGVLASDFEMALSRKKRADKDAVIFEKAHKTLVMGGEVVIDTGILDDEKRVGSLQQIAPITELDNEQLIVHLKHVEDKWSELKRIALLSLRADAPSISKNRFVRKMLDQADAVVEQMDDVLLLMKRGSEVSADKLNALLKSMIIVGLFVFFIIIFYVYYRVIIPLDISLRDLQESKESIEIEKYRAEMASNAKSEFLSSMSHELRTPMNAILGFGQLLELDSEGFTDVQRENVTEILVAGQHLMTLINEVLDLSKIESGTLDLSLEEVQMDDLLEECLSFISVQAKARNLTIINRVSYHGLSVTADFTRLKQVMLNLLSNAVKYNSDNGSITIDYLIVEDKRLLIRITDTGNGLTNDEVDRLFTSFDRLSASNYVEGSGIGLVITKRLVEIMGGCIHVESEPGVGSTFSVEMDLFNV